MKRLGKVKNPVKLLRLLSVWIVLFLIVFAKKTDVADHSPSIKEKKDKVAIASPDDQNVNSFLFVDCTGFFE